MPLLSTILSDFAFGVALHGSHVFKGSALDVFSAVTLLMACTVRQAFHLGILLMLTNLEWMACLYLHQSDCCGMCVWHTMQ